MYLTIETERLIIRPINLLDADFLFRLMNSEGWLKFIGDRQISNTEAAKQYILGILENMHFYYHVFELKDSQKRIGIVTFLNRKGEIYPDIGFALLPEFEKQGYTVEASKSYLERMKGLNKYEAILGITIPDNKGSIKVLQKLGLTHIGDFEKNTETLAYYQIKI